MSSLRSEQLQHFSHVHPLTKVDVPLGLLFICDGCNTYGSEKTYRCASCDYDLHEYCATCPPTLLSSLHPQHKLKLVLNVPNHTCDICDELVKGFHYRCEACDFDVHPLCTQKPQDVKCVNEEVECRDEHSLANLSDTDEGEGEVSCPSKRRRVFRFLKELTVEVIHIVAEM